MLAPGYYSNYATSLQPPTSNIVPDPNVYTYIIVLRNESARYVNTIGFLLAVGSAIMFTREMLIRNAIFLPYMLGVVFIAGLLLWNAYVYYKLDKEIYYSKALLIAGLVWTKMPFLEWLIVVFVILAFLEYQAKLSPEIGFSDDHIVFNRLWKKRFSWQEVEHVILKDGLLTIDFKNNRILQKEIDSGENEASEQEFNDWCKDRLAANGSYPDLLR